MFLKKEIHNLGAVLRNPLTSTTCDECVEYFFYAFMDLYNSSEVIDLMTNTTFLSFT